MDGGPWVAQAELAAQLAGPGVEHEPGDEQQRITPRSAHPSFHAQRAAHRATLLEGRGHGLDRALSAGRGSEPQLQARGREQIDLAEPYGTQQARSGA